MNLSLPKVCIIGTSLAKGGAQRSVAVLSGMLYNLGYEVHVAILTNEIEYTYYGQLYNLGEEKEKANNPISRFKRFRNFKNYLEKQAIDVVIDQRPKNNYYREVFYAKYLYKNTNRIYVVQNSKKSTYFAKPIEKMLKIYASNFHNIGVSQYITDELLLKQGLPNSTYIPNAFLKKSIVKQGKLPSELKDIKKFVLYYGRMDDQAKDIKFLLNAYTASNLWKKDVHLVVMGNGPDKANLVAHSYRLPSSEYIQFLAFQSSPFPVIEKAHAVALTSRHEGFPLVLIESLATGTPVVSLDFISGPSEVIQHRKNGLLVKNRSESEFASALEEMCFNAELHTTCKANAEDSVDAYSGKEVAKLWDKLLRSLAK